MAKQELTCDDILTFRIVHCLFNHVLQNTSIMTVTDSNYAYQYGLPGTFAPIADYSLLNRAAETAKNQGTPAVVGNVLSSDIFYNETADVNDKWRSMGVLAVEMEAAALYMNAARAGKKALCMLTISDHIYRQEGLSAMERQIGFGKMMEIALELA